MQAYCRAQRRKQRAKSKKALLSLGLELTTRSNTSFCESFSTSESDGHLLLHISKQGLRRLLTLHWIVQQATNVRFHYCDLFSFPLFEGDLVMLARPPSSTTAYRSQCTVQPSQCHSTPGSAVLFAPFQTPLSCSPCVLSLCIFIWARWSTFSATSFSGTIYRYYCWMHWEKKKRSPWTRIWSISWHLHSRIGKNCSHNRAAKHLNFSCLHRMSSLNCTWSWWIFPQAIKDIYISPRLSCPLFLAERDGYPQLFLEIDRYFHVYLHVFLLKN